MRHLVLVRHGESTWNVERRIQGQAGAGLSDVGHAQAHDLADWLVESYPDAVLVTSDLRRCRETIAPLAERLGATPRVELDLRERDFGDWQGRLLTEVEADDADRWARWRAGEDVVPEVGGESSVALAARVTGALDRIADDLADGDLAVLVTHGGPVWHGTHAAVGLPVGVLGGVANASLTELARDDAGVHRLVTWNAVGHLPPERRTWLRPVAGRATARRGEAPPVVGR